MKTRLKGEGIYSGRDLSWFDEKKKKGRTTEDNPEKTRDDENEFAFPPR